MGIEKDFHETVTAAVIKAQNYYCEISERWLFHAPESFLQHEIARSITKISNFTAFAELTPKRVLEIVGSKAKFKKSRKRFDIVVINKSKRKSNIRFLVEIKRANSFEPVRKDARKLQKSMKKDPAKALGYLVVYSEVGRKTGKTISAQRKEILKSRFNDWKTRLSKYGWKMKSPFSVSPRDCKHNGKEWSWGVVQFERKPTS